MIVSRMGKRKSSLERENGSERRYVMENKYFTECKNTIVLKICKRVEVTVR